DLRRAPDDVAERAAPRSPRYHRHRFAHARAGRESSRERTMDVEGGMSSDFFTDVPARIGYGGPESSDPLAYAVYQPDRVVAGKRMEDHLRIAVCLWHSFNWPGSDVFGVGT